MAERFWATPSDLLNLEVPMQIVTVKATETWQVPDDRLVPGDVVYDDGTWSSSQRTTLYLAKELPKFVCEVLTGFGFTTTADGVGLDFELLHGRASGLPDIWLTVALLWSARLETLQERVLIEMWRKVQRFLRNRLTADGEFPSVYLEVVFKRGGGCWVDSTGNLVNIWQSEVTAAPT